MFYAIALVYTLILLLSFHSIQQNRLESIQEVWGFFSIHCQGRTWTKGFITFSVRSIHTLHWKTLRGTYWFLKTMWNMEQKQKSTESWKIPLTRNVPQEFCSSYTERNDSIFSWSQHQNAGSHIVPLGFSRHLPGRAR